MTETLTIGLPDDCHAHLRQGEMMYAVLPFHNWANRVVVMPNTNPPIRTFDEAVAYREKILQWNPKFNPKMTLYLTEKTSIPDLRLIAQNKHMFAGCKLYPAGATTGSEFGVRDLRDAMLVLEHMAKYDIPLLVHGEVVNPDVDFFDREDRFCDEKLIPLLGDLPDLRVVLEHITTSEAAWVVSHFPNCFATVTPQHLLCNRNHLFLGSKLRPHSFCLPVLKSEDDRRGVVEAVMKSDKHEKFFAGTDSAPHPRSAKESDCCCGGCFTSPHAVELYAQAFYENGAMDRLDAFMSRNGASFYGWEPCEQKVALVKERWDGQPPSVRVGGDGEIVPWHYGPLDWRLRL